MDYHKDIPKERQIEIFEKQFKIAIGLKKPVSIHCVRAHEDMYKVLEKILGKKDPKKKESDEWKMNILMHCYSGNSDAAKKFQRLNANVYFSFGLVALNRKLPSHIPLENMVVETDSPSLVNEVFLKEKGYNDIIMGKMRGKEEKELLNEPRFLPPLVEKLAEILSIDKLKLMKTLLTNSKRMFNLK